MSDYLDHIQEFDGLRGDGHLPESADYVRPTIRRVLPENTGDWTKMWFKIPHYFMPDDSATSFRSVSCFGRTIQGNGAWLALLCVIVALLLLIK